jgi:hypothetical protein
MELSLYQNKTMKTIMTSHWSPLRRALCMLLLGIAALWAMPRSAPAQLYVSQVVGTVGEYNATTGAAINVTEKGTVETLVSINAVAGTATVTFPRPFDQIPIVTLSGVPFFVNAIVSFQCTILQQSRYSFSYQCQ